MAEKKSEKLSDEQLAKLSYEEGLKQLEELLAKVESGELPLEQAVTAYEKGMKLLKHLKQLLSGAEARLKLIKEEQGEIVTE